MEWQHNYIPQTRYATKRLFLLTSAWTDFRKPPSKDSVFIGGKTCGRIGLLFCSSATDSWCSPAQLFQIVSTLKLQYDTVTAPLTLSMWHCLLLYWDDQSARHWIPLFSSSTSTDCSRRMTHLLFLSWASHDLSSKLPALSSIFPDGNSNSTWPDRSSLPTKSSSFSGFSLVFWEHALLTISFSRPSVRHNQGSNPVCSASAVSFASPFSSSILFLDHCIAYGKFSLRLAFPSPASAIHPY